MFVTHVAHIERIFGFSKEDCITKCQNRVLELASIITTSSFELTNSPRAFTDGIQAWAIQFSEPQMIAMANADAEQILTSIQTQTHTASAFQTTYSQRNEEEAKEIISVILRQATSHYSVPGGIGVRCPAGMHLHVL